MKLFEDIEHRAFAEVRAGGDRTLSGYAAVYGDVADLGPYKESIAPGAFRSSLGKDDIAAMFDHDPGKILGRTRSRTLQLREDAKGLAFELALPDPSHGRDVMALAQRSDLGG